MPAGIVDIHPHIVSSDADRYPIAPLEGKRSDWSKKRSVNFEEMVAAMDDAGVDKAALVQSSTTYGYDASYVADCVARNPQRFTGVFSPDMMAPDAPKMVRYWAVERKLGGIRLYTAGATHEKQSGWMADPAIFPAMEEVQRLDLSVCVSMKPAGIPQAEVLFQKFPKTRFVIDHMTEPPIAEGPPYTNSQYLLDLAKYPNVYMKLTTLSVRASRKENGSPETFFPLLVRKFGASRIAWGSNYPSAQGSLKEMVTEAQSALACLTAEDRDWIFAKTALSLYPILAQDS